MVGKSLMVAALGAVLTVPGGHSVNAQGDVGEAVRIERGEHVAKVWCSSCHQVVPAGEEAVRTEAPAFAEIADRPDQSVESLEGFLVSPHPPMPDLSLGRTEMRDLALYILSLKTDG